MIAKFELRKIETPVSNGGPIERLSFRAVTEKPFDSDGASEDNSFSRWTPDGSLEMLITNPNLVGTFKEGQKFYLEFTPAD